MTKSIHWVPFLSLLKREIRRFFKVIVQTVMTPLINSSLYFLIFGVSLGDKINVSSGVSYLGFLIPGLAMMGCLNNSYQNSSSSIVSSRFGGSMEDFKTSLLSETQLVWALSIGGIFRGLLVGLLTFFVGVSFYYFQTGEWFVIHQPLALLWFVVVGGLIFSSLGIIVAFRAQSFDQMSTVSSFVLTPLIFLGGVFYSTENLSPFWRGISELNPLLYLINGVRYGMLGVSDVSPGVAFWVSLVFLMIFHFLARITISRGTFSRW